MGEREEVVMRVNEIMTESPKACAPDSSVREAAVLMRDNDCGVLPVVQRGRLVGIVTDRDLCLGLAECDRPASQVSVDEIMFR
jgi:CBS domain-containing protein